MIVLRPVFACAYVALLPGAGSLCAFRVVSFILGCMQLNVTTYYLADSAVHACDARVKIVLLAAYSITLFLVETWVGLGILAASLFAALALSRVPARCFTSLMLPVYVIMAFTMLFNGFSADVAQASVAASGLGNVSAGFLASVPPVPLLGSFGLVPAGFARGCFYAARIALLVIASLLVSFTTTSNDMTAALNSFLRPLRVLHAPVDDIAAVLSIALRFIPVLADELQRVHAAQWARCAPFGEGSLRQRLGAWQTVMIPLFVGLFRRADVLAVAMDARCYGAPETQRTSLAARSLGPGSAVALAIGLAVCVALAVWL